MTQLWTTAFTLFWAVSASACESQIQSGLYISAVPWSASGNDCSTFPDLDTAISTLELQKGGAIYISQAFGTVLYPLGVGNISTHIVIFGNGTDLDIRSNVHVTSSGDLELDDFQISSTESESELFTVDGSLKVSNSRIHDLEQTFAIVAGSISVFDSQMTNCSYTLLITKQWNVTAVLSNSIFQGNNATILQLLSDPSLVPDHPTLVLVRNCTFQDNQAAALFSLSAIRNPQTSDFDNFFSLGNCSFVYNQGILVDLEVNEFNVSIVACGFVGNVGGGLVIEAYDSMVTVTQCSFTSNTGSQISVLSLIGQVIVNECVFSDQQGTGPIQILNSGNVGQCVVLLLQTSFLNYHFTALSRSAGVVLGLNCGLFLSGIQVSNVNVTGNFGLLTSFFDFQSASVTMNAVSVVNSACSQFAFYLILDDFNVTDCALLNVSVGINTLALMSLNALSRWENVQIAGARGISTSDALYLGEPHLLYIVLYASSLYLSNIKIKAENVYSVVGQIFGSLTLRHMWLEFQYSEAQLFPVQSSVTDIEDLYVTGMKAVTLFAIGHNCLFSAKDVYVQSTAFSKVMTCSTNSICSVVNMTVLNVTAQTLGLFFRSNGFLSFLNVNTSVFEQLITGFSNSDTLVTNARINGGSIQLASLFESVFTLANTTISAVSCGGDFICEIGSIALFDTVQIYNLTFPDSERFGHLTEGSILTIQNAIFAGIKLTGTTGFDLDESSIVIANSSISQFPFTFIVGMSSNITISDSSFQYGGPVGDSILLKGAIFSCQDCEFMSVSGLQANGLSSYSGGCISVTSALEEQKPRLYIVNSSFNACSAHIGGVLQVTNTPFQVANSYFRDCVSTTTGGAIDVFNSGNGSIIIDSSFARNSASAGGALKFHKGIVSLENVLFTNNTAGYGPDVASYGVQARFSKTFDINAVFLSGNELETDLVVELLDHFQQVVLTDNLAQLVINQTEDVSYGGFESVVCQNGVFNLTKYPFYAPPGTNQTITALVSEDTETTEIMTELSFLALFRNCTAGEAYLPDRCQICAPGTYSFSPEDGVCALCPRNVFCPGRNEFNISSGYWRSSVNTSVFFGCPFAESCLGGTESVCAAGYTGKLCTECQSNWYRFGTLYCQECSDYSTGLQITAFLLQYLLFIYLAYYLTEVKPNELKTGVVRVWIDHCQCSILLLRLRTQLPVVFMNVYRGLGYMGSLSLAGLPLHCFFTQGSEVYGKAIAAMVLPVGVVVAYCCLALVRVVSFAWDKLFRFVILVSFLLSPSVMETFMTLIVTVSLDGNVNWLYEDASVQVWTGTHLWMTRGIVGPVLVVYLLVPMILLLLAKAFKAKTVLRRYAPYICGGCKGAWCSLEVLYYWMKLTLITTLIGLTPKSALLQVTLSLATLIPVLVLYVAFQIYSSSPLLVLNVASKLTVFTALSASFYFAEYSGSPNMDYAFAAGLLVMNGLVCGGCLMAAVGKWGNVVKPGDIVYLESLSVLQQHSTNIRVPDNSLVEKRD